MAYNSNNRTVTMLSSLLSQNTLESNLFRVQTKYKQLIGNWIQ